MSCHALGTIGTRTIPKQLGEFSTSAEAWERRIQSGQAMTQMTTVIGRLDVPLAFKLFADWTDRIAGGELPFAQPPRPQGIERNVVLTLWDWGRPTGYLHDEISTDRRTPTVNANGKLYGTTEESTDFIPILDPVHNTAVEVKHPVRDPKTPSSKDAPMGPSPYWGEEPIWDSQTSNHNPMMTRRGASGSPHESARQRIPISARGDRSIHPQRCSRSSRLTATFQCMIRQPASSP